jgi:hypothetical protein
MNEKMSSSIRIYSIFLLIINACLSLYQYMCNIMHLGIGKKKGRRKESFTLSKIQSGNINTFRTICFLQNIMENI